ncbi:carboxypeptidase-like regulatory domain-containing protein [Winogradskyella flava]|uniref:Carboxypeptidase-like regulatory domain-containing protein n=1 Tax=Winogradskyella flava TaxID=1884876 RepID=A0A842IWB9_9FLAO|nr:carboxypeptidase-like regulatory domain-containing protein [Winogradskyella flava]MBC2846419.1 carboxypeptidase-like regulatory domain-containing protein [Winogradskyella flava]
MKKITFLLAALSFSMLSFSQIIIKGIVQNDSMALESANIIIKNSKKGTATNSKGQFRIEAKKGDTLSVSYLGYETKDIVLDDDTTYKIRLEESNQLDEVVVNAYDQGLKTNCRTTCTVVSRCGICTVGIEIAFIESYEGIKLYPNPSSDGIFQIKLNNDYNEVKILVANINGQIIQNTTHQMNGEKLNLDLFEYAIGIYIVNIMADGQHLEAIKAIKS